MSLIEKYISQSEELNSEYRVQRNDNKVLFSQAATNLSSVFWIKEVLGFPSKENHIIRIEMNSTAMEFIKSADKKINWKDFQNLPGWYFG